MQQFVRHASVELKQEYDDWGILFNTETNQGIVVNLVGMMIWEALGEGNDLAGITSSLEKEFEDAPDSLAEDVQEFLNQLVRAGAVLG